MLLPAGGRFPSRTVLHGRLDRSGAQKNLATSSKPRRPSRKRLGAISIRSALTPLPANLAFLQAGAETAMAEPRTRGKGQDEKYAWLPGWARKNESRYPQNSARKMRTRKETENPVAPHGRSKKRRLNGQVHRCHLPPRLLRGRDNNRALDGRRHGLSPDGLSPTGGVTKLHRLPCGYRW